MSIETNGNEILEKLRNADDSLERVKLSEIELSAADNGAHFRFVCDKAVSEQVGERVKNILSDYLPERFKRGLTVEFSKLVADRELVGKDICEFLKTEFMSVSHCISPEKIRVSTAGESCFYKLTLDDDACEYFESNGVVDKINEYLSAKYCSDFSGSVESAGKTSYDESLLDEKPDFGEVETLKCRTLTVGDPVKIWGEEIGGEAIYIADAEIASGKVCFAGMITAKNERTARNGKIFYVVELFDTTGRISGKIFMTKEKEKKIDKLQVGSSVITRGELGYRNGYLDYKIEDVSYCEFPADFKMEDRPKKSVPANYKLVFPEPLTENSQANLFAVERAVPECLMGKTFVVVDLETTGVSYLGGDKITEIGAVKITDGKIVSKFTTLIDPHIPISQRITDLTGIDDALVAGKPTFEEVLPDFYKYCHGATIIAHNIDFDYNFIKFMSKDTGYEFTNESIDTVALSKAVVPGLKNYKLNTVCGHFKIEFLHHRAMSDAHATAKLFLELIFIKKSLP